MATGSGAFNSLFLGLGGLRLLRNDGEDVDALAHFLAAHEEDVEEAGRGDGGEGDEAGERRAGRGGEVLEPGHELVEADGDTAGDGDGHGVGLAELAPG